ncbi:MAG: DUF1624 domain-containing protein [Bryobacteraceae bacterium]
MAANTPPVTSALKGRVRSVDALRGFVMILMALDHTREFFHTGAMSFQPEDLTRTTTALFLTRWVTHICAPVFMFTAGMAAYFWRSKGHSTGELSRFLWTRGLWLVLLDLTVMRFALHFSFTSGILILNVLWALGWSMVALGFLAHLPVRVLAILSMLVIGLHNLADPIGASQFGAAAWMWNLLHQAGAFRAGSALVLAAYPLVPWIFVMSAGFCFGRIATLDPVRRRWWFVRIGACLTIAFFLIRGLNLYGDPQPWSAQVPGMTVLSFLRTTKYPPSLDFLLMTLGPAILLLAWLDQLRLSAANPVVVFGRVPLFFFIIHLYVIHALSFPLALLRYGEVAFLRNPLPSLGGSRDLYPADYGYDLWVVYALWLTVLVVLYPVCRWFARLKERRRDWWLSYV